MYQLKRIIKNQPEITVELDETQLNIIYDALDVYYDNLQYNGLFPDELQVMESDVRKVMQKLEVV